MDCIHTIDTHRKKINYRKQCKQANKTIVKNYTHTLRKNIHIHIYEDTKTNNTFLGYFFRFVRKMSLNIEYSYHTTTNINLLKVQQYRCKQTSYEEHLFYLRHCEI